MLSVEHYLRRAERFRLEMLTTDDLARQSRLRDIIYNYRRLADKARLQANRAALTAQASVKPADAAA
jgi:hypothetical protein